MHAGTISKNKLLLCSFLVLYFLQVHCGTLLIEVQFHSVSADLSQEFHLLLLYVISSSVPFLTITDCMLRCDNLRFLRLFVTLS